MASSEFSSTVFKLKSHTRIISTHGIYYSICYIIVIIFVSFLRIFPCGGLYIFFRIHFLIWGGSNIICNVSTSWLEQ